MQQFILIGFTQDNGFRLFSFDRIASDRVRTRCVVKADLSLVLRYGIQIQDLPLLCRGLLDRCQEGSEIAELTFAEDDMRECARERDAAREVAAKKRKSWHKSGTENLRVAGEVA
jgi:hypothetical protein